MRRLALPVVVLSLLLAACGSPPATIQPATVAPGAAKIHPSSSAPSAAAVAPAVLGDYKASANARADIKKALAAARKDHKPVLVDFGADWCPDCLVLGRLAAKPQAAPFLSRFHVVSVDVGRFDKNIGVADDLTVDLDASGIPALVVLDAKGKVRKATNDGSFSNARTMSAGDVAAFLKKWS